MGYTLDSIIKEYLIEIGDSQLNKYARFYQIAVSGLRELNINTSGVTKTINMPIKVNNTCDLPLDYLNYKVIGLLGADNSIYAIGRNDKLSTLQYFDDCGESSPQPSALTNINDSVNGMSPIVSSLIPDDYTDNYRNGEFMGRMFGVNGGNNGYGEFKIDVENGVILLSNLAPSATYVIMEYLADIESIEGDFEVHPFVVEALKAWIYWKHIQRDRNRSVNEKEVAKQDYNIAARWSKKRFTSSTIEEWKQAFRSGNTMSVKF